MLAPDPVRRDPMNPVPSSESPEPHAGLPRIALLGTGGTIAAVAADATQLQEYTVSTPIDELLAAVPQVRELADVQCEQVVNVDSRDIDNAILLQIARRADAVLGRADVDGLVVTHGTDTLEETAYFLNLVLKTAKPVVIVGAMRPATPLGADGPLNLYHAFRVATCAEARGKGVLVVMNDRIAAARFVTKAALSAAEAFRAGAGELGQIAGGVVHFYAAPLRRHTADTEFSLAAIDALPHVDILYDHQSAGLHLYHAAIAAGAQGLVVAGLGNGGLSPAARAGVQAATRRGLVVVRASRVGTGIVTASADDAMLGTVAANSLNPQKARVLLMLALGRPCDVADVRRCFEVY
jgi:L-asparaginase